MQTNFNSIAKVEHSHYGEECVVVIYVALAFSINTESICKSTTEKLLPAKPKITLPQALIPTP
jgi:hypothetical protein